MNLHHLDKQHPLDLGGSHSTALNGPVSLPDDIFADDSVDADLYPEVSLAIPSKKHSADFVQNRLKLRHIAAAKLAHLSEELYKLADEVRYYDPLMAEVLDDAFDATSEAIALMEKPH